MELFSALDNALSQKAQDTLTEFAAVKKADVQLQTPLGNSQGTNCVSMTGMGAFTFFAVGKCGLSAKDIGGANARRVDGETFMELIRPIMKVASMRLWHWRLRFGYRM